MMRRVAAAVSLVLLAGCSGSSGGRSTDASVCVDALDAADAGFRDMASNVETVQEALRQAFDGNLRDAQVTLDQVSRVSPDRYKRLEQQCRDTVGQ